MVHPELKVVILKKVKEIISSDTWANHSMFYIGDKTPEAIADSIEAIFDVMEHADLMRETEGEG